MLLHGYMLTTSIAYGEFDYHGKLEFNGIEKNPIYGSAYVKAFLDNEKGQPKIQPGQCRVIKQNLLGDIDLLDPDFNLLKVRQQDTRYLYYYWHVHNHQGIEEFEQHYNDSYKLKYAGMLEALRIYNGH